MAQTKFGGTRGKLTARRNGKQGLQFASVLKI